MDQFRRLLSSLTTRQKISLVVAAIAVGAALYGLASWSREHDFRPLYTDLAPADAGQIVNHLKQNGITYRVADGGTTVLVPSAKVAETRLQMAAAGLPKTGRIGFELFDKTNFGITDFAEQVNYHRALEGELERSVMAMVEVERARVHITAAKDSVFSSSRRPAKASVLVRLRPGAKLSPQNVQALAYLVASAVEGLQPEAVSVMDMQGNLLKRPRKGGLPGSAEPSDATLEYRRSIEKNLLAKINSTLEPVLGPDGFRAGVTVECDFTSGEQSQETFDPSKSIMTSSQRTEETSGSPVSGGVPGTASNLPHPVPRSASLATSGHTRRTENVNYQTSRTVRRIHLSEGQLKRISVSLLVDYGVESKGTGKNAKRTLVPPSAAKLKSIRALVAGAIGLRPDRGDQLIVESLPFESTRNWRPPATSLPGTPDGGLPVPAWLAPYVKNQRLLAIAGAGVVVVILLMAAALLSLLRKRRNKRRVTSVSTRHAIGASPELEAGADVEAQMHEQLAGQLALKEKMEKEALNSLKLPEIKTKKTEVLAKHIAEEAEKDPAAMANLVRTWLNEEGR